MPTLSKIPEFLQKTGYKNPEGAVNGPFNHTENFPETIWQWVGQDQAKLDACNTFMEADRGSRPSWLEWFPAKERVVDGFDASSDGKLLVDVAGGRGHDIDAFRRKFPDISTPGRLVVEDLPQVIGDIHDLDSSIERVGFDLFDSQPVKGALSFPFLHSISNPYLTCMHACTMQMPAHTTSNSSSTTGATATAARSCSTWHPS